MIQTLPAWQSVAVLIVALPGLPAPAWWSGRNPGVRARWATRRDLRPLAVAEPTPGRMTLGTAGRQLLAAEPQHSLIVFGPTGSGSKTCPSSSRRCWNGPAPPSSPPSRPGVLDHTEGHRSAGGPVFVYDPTGSHRTAVLDVDAADRLRHLDRRLTDGLMCSSLGRCTRSSFEAEATRRMELRCEILRPYGVTACECAVVAGRGLAHAISWVAVNGRRDFPVVGQLISSLADS